MNDQAQKLRDIVKNRDLQRHNPAQEYSRSHCRSFAVTSGKGGVGKTTFSLALAASLSKLRKKVLLLDADLGLANVHILLGLAPKKTISDVVSGECSIEDVIVTAPGNLDLIPGASGLEALANIDTGRLERLRLDFMRLEQKYDYLLIDTGAGIGSVVTHFASNADTALLVMTPEPTSLADAYAMVKVLYEKGNKKISVIVNMVSSDRQGIETFDRLNALVVKFLKKPLELASVLCTEREVKRNVHAQKLLLKEHPNNRYVIRVGSLARKISGLPDSKRESFFARMWSGVSTKE
ncbi:Flagellar synthesis regulator FleN [Chitinispirillum alkaliphilum]|nr:Flagellar synthesis regulator FleN [Chitinispirillum alkaliphilum]